MWNSPEPYDFFLSGINSLAGISVSTLLAIYIALLITPIYGIFAILGIFPNNGKKKNLKKYIRGKKHRFYSKLAGIVYKLLVKCMISHNGNFVPVLIVITLSM